jgi:hypothetical protein
MIINYKLQYSFIQNYLELFDYIFVKLKYLQIKKFSIKNMLNFILTNLIIMIKE